MNTPTANRLEYERRLHRVFAYIDEHLAEDLDLRRLARQASFSAFHFHRIFTAHTGEPLGAYLTRRRIEQAAARLASQPRLSVLAVALEVGFSSPEAFARAFRKRFDCPPSAWKRRRIESPLVKSKRDQVKGKRGQVSEAETVYSRRMNQKSSVSELSVDVARRPAARVCTLRYQGPFGAPLGKFWQEKVYPFLAAHNLLGAPRFGISQDDPAITRENQCRYDAGAAVGPDFAPPPGAQLTLVPAGLYASTEFFGTSKEIPATWDRILRDWLPSSGYQLDARPCFEYYPPDGTYDKKSGKFTAELCIPLKPLV